ncbi:hypothetical protein CYMTET_45806, partial [Cymbomonas tetramitiformis]
MPRLTFAGFPVKERRYRLFKNEVEDQVPEADGAGVKDAEDLLKETEVQPDKGDKEGSQSADGGPQKSARLNRNLSMMQRMSGNFFSAAGGFGEHVVGGVTNLTNVAGNTMRDQISGITTSGMSMATYLASDLLRLPEEELPVTSWMCFKWSLYWWWENER